MIRIQHKTFLRPLFLLTFFLSLISTHPALGDEPYPAPQGLINDFANVIPPAYEERMNSLAHEVLAKADATLTVVTLKDIGGANIDEFTNRLYERWGVGKKGEDRGIMILVASCYDGIGPDDYAGMLQSGSSPEDLAAKFEEIKVNYQLGWHKVGSIPPFLVDKELWMVTQLEQDSLDRMFFKGFKSVQKAIDAAIKKKGPNTTFLVVKDSANVCPTTK